MHPSDLKQDELENVEQIKVGNERGEIEIDLEANEEVQPAWSWLRDVGKPSVPSCKRGQHANFADAAFPMEGPFFTIRPSG